LNDLFKHFPVPACFLAIAGACGVIANGVKAETLNGQFISWPAIVLMYIFFALAITRVLFNFPRLKHIDG
jgi:hypothetical protein